MKFIVGARVDYTIFVALETKPGVSQKIQEEIVVKKVREVLAQGLQSLYRLEDSESDIRLFVPSRKIQVEIEAEKKWISFKGGVRCVS